ncbi:hypothetical protein Daus18300_000390 [Diaporthe australafricana]|uniref:Heterokaryon incompatibility domain-containing protein n=1 Tax=Diaporthe australafricana TaxID=127596 RepID=A0ABR3Y6A0_9PEZI
MHIEHAELFHACVSIKIRMSAFTINTILRDNFSRAREVEIEMRDWSCFILTHQDVIDLGLATTRLPSDTGSIRTWSTVEGWIQECYEQHQCLAQVDTNWYPTRLVEITSSETFRIIRSDSSLFQPGPGYITLSHRWGDGEFATLTTDTLPAFERGSQINTLRKTFQDALVIAQRMGIPYIWIDSLCIIQFGDDGTDWRQESAAMAQVYSNSLCNISADWGDECNGLFFERRPQYVPPCSLEMQLGVPETEPQPGDNIESSYGVPRPLPRGACYVVRRGGWLKDVMGSPLSSRGWVMQERLLAPRALHFSPDGIVWECGLRVASERIPSRTVDSSRTERLFWSLDPPGGGSEEHTMKRLSLRERARDTSWPDIVKQYTWCSLTKVSDKLVAIAGIAQTLSPIVKDQYVAGLWAKSLPESLAWKADKLRERRGGPTQYYAPTFSWAAADGVVEMEPFPPRGSRDIVSAVFIKYRKKNVSPLVTKQMRSGLDDSVLADDVFGPITSPEVEVRVQGILRSCRRIPQQLTLGRDVRQHSLLIMIVMPTEFARRRKWTLLPSIIIPSS